MSFQSYNPHNRYRNRAAHRLSSFLAYLALMLIAGLIGFWLGKQYGAEKLITAQAKVETLLETEKQQQEQITELSTKVQATNMRFEKLKKNVESTTPIGKAKDLVQLINTELDKGADAERLSFIIKSGRPPTGCIDPETKHFVVATPLYKGPVSQVEIAGGAIKISAKGVSAKNDKGEKEVWYDPQRTITASFSYDDKKSNKKGVMPIRQSLIVGEREYRFTIESGAQSFAKVTFDSCNYP